MKNNHKSTKSLKWQCGKQQSSESITNSRATHHPGKSAFHSTKAMIVKQSKRPEPNSIQRDQQILESATGLVQKLDVENILTPRQVKTLQLVNYLTPIMEDEYEVVVQKITSMTNRQLAELYMKLYHTYLDKENGVEGSWTRRNEAGPRWIKKSAKEILSDHSLELEPSSIRIKKQSPPAARKTFGGNGTFICDSRRRSLTNKWEDNSSDCDIDDLDSNNLGLGQHGSDGIDEFDI